MHISLYQLCSSSRKPSLTLCSYYTACPDWYSTPQRTSRHRQWQSRMSFFPCSKPHRCCPLHHIYFYPAPILSYSYSCTYGTLLSPLHSNFFHHHCTSDYGTSHLTQDPSSLLSQLGRHSCCITHCPSNMLLQCFLIFWSPDSVMLNTNKLRT